MTGVPRGATLLLAVAGALGVAAPVSAAERVVQIGRDGVRPQLLQVAPGDTVRFVNSDPTFAYRARSTGGSWRFDSGPTTLLADDYVVPSTLTRPGTYTYRVAQDLPFHGTVVVGAPPAAAPAPAVTSAPVASAPVTSAPVAPAPGPVVPAPVAAPAVPGPLPGQRSDRALGLAVAVAGVLLAGTASLLLRLLLALPVLSDRAARP